jgi:tetratricopeptide (TPR) repeat protein
MRSVSPEAIQAELERLTQSPAFARAPRHARFLRHLVGLSLAGDSAGQREMALGVAVFGRPASTFDPRLDSIVRVEARRLRAKLAQYYANPACRALVEFVLPVGSYALDIRPRAWVDHPPVREAVSLGRAALTQGTPAGVTRALELADEALRLSPRDGSAWLLRATAFIVGVGQTVLPAPGAMPAAKAAAEAALRDPALDAGQRAEALGHLATVAFSFERRWPEARRALQQALQFEPRANLYANLGWMQMFCANFDAARLAYAQARAIDPVSLTFRTHEGLIELYARRYPRAQAVFEAVLSAAPGHLVAQSLDAALHLYTGRVSEGLDAYRRLNQQLPQLSIGRCGIAQALALAGEREAAVQACQALEAEAQAGQAPPYQVAMVKARLGDHAGTLEWLALAASRHDFNFVCVGVDPAFDWLRGSAAFEAMLLREGIETLTH